ncbi:hypothetical protein [Candidatus Cyanaurora vandensis]|uniref:hypothetical protein n=1 Tax=Candidatus Cyanaurora vandensis TaxID=2714958 RepID=UPI00257D2255|nr:hypothetical protein [Candidatus Cyanaurora vandensis]
MARSKLSEAEREELVRLYRETPKTATRLAEDFSISVSTVARMLRAAIPEADYNLLSQGKRRGTLEAVAEEILLDLPETPLALEIQLPIVAELEPEIITPVLELTPEAALLPVAVELPAAELLPPITAVVEASILEELVETGLEADTDLDSELFSLEPDSEDSLEPGLEDSYLPTAVAAPPLEVLPYHRMELPEICYIVVDRWAELIVRPLGEFNFLENVPPQEQEAVALPVFDSHRWAKRFSNRFQRILRVPTRLLDVTRPYLMNRGITRLLVGRQVFALAQEIGEEPLMPRVPVAVADLPTLGERTLDEEEFETLAEFDEAEDGDEGEDEDGPDNF